MIGFIYKTTCLVNNKIYIGKHEGKEEDKYLGSGEAFTRAVRKYGKENFKREILRRCDTLHELRVWEQHPEMKQRLSDRRRGVKSSDETKKKLSDSHRGIKRTEEWKRKISEANSGEGHWAYRKTFSEEFRKKLSESIKGKMSKEKHPLWERKCQKKQERKCQKNKSKDGKIYRKRSKTDSSKGMG